MKTTSASPAVESTAGYAKRLSGVLADHDWSSVDALIQVVRDAWRDGRDVFIAGNGGSAANSMHWANDFLYPVAETHGRGLRVTALTANSAILTCLANDTGYENVFAYQLKAFAEPGDVLIVLSGSGNSANILFALRTAKEIGMHTTGVFGFDGGAALTLVDVAVHFQVHDMQLAEDLQLVVNHMVMQALRARGPSAD